MGSGIATKLFDCETRVLWLGEDESGTVIAVGKSTWAITQEHGPINNGEVHGEILHAFTHGKLLTIQERDGQFQVTLPDGSSLSLPISHRETFDSQWVPQIGAVFILGTDELVRLEFSGTTHVLARNELNGEPFERLVANANYAAIYRYGLRVFENKNNRLVVDMSDLLYSQSAFLSPHRLIAATPDGRIDVIDIQSRSRNQVACVDGEILHIAVTKEIPILISRNGDVIRFGTIASEFLESAATSHPSGAECACVIESLDSIAIGTMQGVVLLWNVVKNELREIPLPEPERIVQMMWSDRRQKLFLGTRHGAVFAVPLRD